MTEIVRVSDMKPETPEVMTSERANKLVKNFNNTVDYLRHFDDYEWEVRKAKGEALFHNNEPGPDGSIARAKQLGLRRTSRNSCPRLLVGKARCWEDQWKISEKCWCNNRLNDHGATWKSVGSGRKFVLWEPYGIDCEELVKVVARAEDCGLRARISTSFWYPSRTVGIWFFKDEYIK